MRTTEPLTKRLRRAVRFLRKEFPVPIPVTVRMHKEMKGLCGCVLIEEGQTRALIRIAEDSDYVMCETLMEEWAHILRHLVHVPIEKEHDQIFWAIYGEVIMKFRGGE